MNIKRVAVLGAGAVGSYVIWGLSNNKDITLGVIASGERNERLKKRGIMINGTQYTPEVWTPEEAKNVDLLIVSLKYGSLRGALDDIQTIVGENTTVMSLMNGVDSEEIISEKIDRSHILYSFIKVASQGKEDGYHFDPETTVGIYFGELEEPYESERVKAVNDILKTQDSIGLLQMTYRQKSGANLDLMSAIICHRQSWEPALDAMKTVNICQRSAKA